ncbi:MAG: ankyrin repeat domain-containing protein [Candidatus Accumulibacter sp.]|uniref:ankyrin repeat domain-containing protein n=1 Tax=Accumulibacter sp. TaxID=2053492 RepID=UPI001AC289A1|nr:ankyrin repeat domain-containing protein [Accumulibacter sp.]MBN8517781.1 ankyrin repeat domain-containing protein [Accumulibacter sp.]MBO3711043.1 ankyrin repeat domain-containing protein [Accumulibacter sp.]
MSTNKHPAPPYPRLGELYRALTVALGTKGNNSDIDVLARKGEFNWALLPVLGEESVIAPLAKYIDPEFAQMVGQSLAYVHQSYLRLVLSLPLDSLSREQSLPLLIEHYFALHALGLIVGIKKGFGGPDLMRFFDPELHPVAVVMGWLDDGQEISLVKLAYPKTVGSDRDQAEKCRKWSKGTDLPDPQSIVRFSKALKDTGSVSEEKLQNLRCWLMVSRTVAHLERESPVSFRGAMRRHLLLGMPDFDIGRLLSLAVVESGKPFSTLTMPALTLYERLKRTTEKEVGEQAKLKAELDQFERLSAAVEPEGRTRFHIEWMRGRWYVLSGKFDLALPHYESAAELANYRAGSQQKQIVEEALVLAGYLRKKALLKRLKHRAVAFGLFANPRGDDVVEDWEVDHFSQQFHQVFPVEGRFPETLADDVEVGPLPFLVFDEDEISQVKIDRRSPDRVISIKFRDGQVRRWSQLRFFASFNRLEEVKALLDLGASVEKLDESGGSALLCAIQEAAQTGDRRVLDLLLNYQHSISVLNSVTVRKQLTPLLCAVDLGEPDVVEKLLLMGASPDLRGNVVDQTPLYLAMERLGAVRSPGKLYQFLCRSLAANPDLVKKEVLRRYNVSLAGVFGDGDGLRKLREMPLYAELFERLASAMVEEQMRRHSVPKLIRIVELLLEHRANPNATHRYPEPGRTPIMLAAENNSGWAFALMLRHHGDPYRKDEAGMDCLKIATAFRSAEVLGYMRSKGIV